jgi:HSP20 family protein
MYFDPFTKTSFPTALEALRSIQAEFDRRLGREGASRSSPMAFAVFSREGRVLLRTPLPGVEAQDVSIEVHLNRLTISGRFAEEPERETALAAHLERPRGSFKRTLHLPFDIDASRVKARLERGVLEVEAAPRADTLPIRIQVQAETKRN